MRTKVLSVSGVTGIGYREDRKKVEVTVNSEKALDTAKSRVGDSVAGYNIEYNVVGEPEFLVDRKKKYRPVKSGISIGNEYITAGTLGYVPSTNGEMIGLSNTHVLTPVGSDRNPRVGQSIIQPGPMDGGSDPEDKVGELKDWIEYDKEGLNYADAAIYTPTDNHINTIIGKDGKEVRPRGIGKVEVGDKVWKAGRTTGYTEGVVKYLNHDMKVNAGGEYGTLTFADQLVIEDKRGSNYQFVAGGDSGSLLLNMDNEVVGLVFAGSTEPPYVGVISPIKYVTGMLDVEIAGSEDQQVESGFNKWIAGATATGILGTMIYKKFS